MRLMKIARRWLMVTRYAAAVAMLLGAFGSFANAAWAPYLIGVAALAILVVLLLDRTLDRTASQARWGRP
jgi:hypothetical protein